ncbi:MAG: alpha-1,4-glucan--maltose-1-phosphate maltosyltransferase [Pseudomonadota bacterium]
MSIEQRRISIQGVTPQVDGGRYEVKAVAGDVLQVGADIYKDGHDQLRAVVLWRPLAPGERVPVQELAVASRRTRKGWREAPLTEGVNDRWHGRFEVDAIGPWAFTVLAWTDRFWTWREELRKKHEAQQSDLKSELLEGQAIVENYGKGTAGRDHKDIQEFLAAMRAADSVEHGVELGLHPRLAELMQRNDPRTDATLYPFEIPLWVDRERARFSAWYEIFVRSQGQVPGRGATFREAEQRLPAIAAMGFDVLYLTPIHPIGLSHRKGANNNPLCKRGEPGSPWAIGSPDGGHTAVHPELGTLDDFDHFRAHAEALGLEIALDLAVQCSPDHPWVTEHPEWFAHRPDGSIKYAENPPKKYQDIYPIDFDTRDRDGLYNALLEVFLFWVEHGVKIFRVDNPHTKPATFWEWLIASVHREHPDVLFLAEAFTRPKRMYTLAKLGFSQSYSYFTWRNTKSELASYALELFNTDVADFYRPNFFANTPDILHAYLQQGGRPAFIARLVLASTLSPSYGIYSGYELCENTPLREGSEEYLDSEKYEFKNRDWQKEGHITHLVARTNSLRHQNPALRLAANFRLLDSTSPGILAFAKATPDGENVVIVVVNVDPHQVHEGTVHVPIELVGSSPDNTFHVTDLLTDAVYTWRAGDNYVRLDPRVLPAHVLRVARA